MNPPFNLLVVLTRRVIESVHFTDNSFMNLSTCGLMVSFQRMVKPIHFMDLIVFK